MGYDASKARAVPEKVAGFFDLDIIIEDTSQGLPMSHVEEDIVNEVALPKVNGVEGELFLVADIEPELGMEPLEGGLRV